MPGHAQIERQLGSHYHGVANLDLVIEGENIAVSFETPAANLVGFEYAPVTDNDKAKVEATRMQLMDINHLLNLPDSAGCRVAEVSVEWHQESHDEHDEHKESEHADDHEDHDEHEHDEHEHDEHEHDEHKESEHEDGHEEHDEHEHDEHEESEQEDHAEFHAEYLLECAGIDDLSVIEVVAFDLYSDIEAISLRAVLPEGQIGLSLDAENNQFSITK